MFLGKLSGEVRSEGMRKGRFKDHYGLHEPKCGEQLGEFHRMQTVVS